MRSVLAPAEDQFAERGSLSAIFREEPACEQLVPFELGQEPVRLSSNTAGARGAVVLVKTEVES